jgi:putative endonuclease
MTSGRGYTYYVYVLTNRSGTLYTGVTSSIEERVRQHKAGLHDGFTKRYRIDRLVYYEELDDVNLAIAREKQIKGWSRKKKIDLINELNLKWLDLSDGWYAED